MGSYRPFLSLQSCFYLACFPHFILFVQQKKKPWLILQFPWEHVVRYDWLTDSLQCMKCLLLSLHCNWCGCTSTVNGETESKDKIPDNTECFSIAAFLGSFKVFLHSKHSLLALWSLNCGCPWEGMFHIWIFITFWKDWPSHHNHISILDLHTTTISVSPTSHHNHFSIPL